MFHASHTHTHSHELGLEWLLLCLAAAEDFKLVQKEVSEILEGRILVGHAVHNDLKVGHSRSYKRFYIHNYLPLGC